MSAAFLPEGHAGFSALQVGRRVAAELAREAIDTAAPLTMADRLALTAMALAVDIEVSARAGVEPIADAREAMAKALARVERNRPR